MYGEAVVISLARIEWGRVHVVCSSGGFEPGRVSNVAILAWSKRNINCDKEMV